ncbi:MAG: TIGR03936 family radical SAM-associated protein [Phycisphaerae bacterium]
MILPQYWALWLRVEGDLRFLSHLDMMRAMGRVAGRSRLPVRYTQGFNPHPVLSLPCPRPVGVASLDDVLVMALEEPDGAAADAKLDARAIVGAMNRSAPRGMTFTRAQRLEGAKTLHPRRAEYELALDHDRAGRVRDRLGELAAMASWPVERAKGEDAGHARTIDLHPLVADARLEGDMLRWSHVPQGQSWARPAEFLGLLGLDGRVDLACAIRVRVEYE